MADHQTDGGSQPNTGQASQFGIIFYVSVAISVAFVLFGVLFTGIFNSALKGVSNAILQYFGWGYLLMVSFFVVFSLFLGLSRYGKIRLGGEDAQPEFRFFPWFAMLFQSGMGVGLLFWAVSEPLLHQASPPFNMAKPQTAEAASLGMQYSFFHWTLHPWAVYSVVGLAVAYFSYNKGMGSLRISTVFYPLLGDRIYGPIGKTIDIVAVLSTLFGVAVSMGLATLQIRGGLSVAFGLSGGDLTLLVIIGVIAIIYLLSASTPIEKGVNFFSQLAIYLAVLLMAFVFILGPTVLQLNTLTQETGRYLINLIPMSLRMDAFNNSSAGSDFLLNWTVFFWATWIAWAPFVGSFIARISRGRTIREFIIGVLVAPSLGSMVWFSVFGSSAIKLNQSLGGSIAATAQNSAAEGLFSFLAQYPLPLITSALAIILAALFFITGADSGTIVLGGMTSGFMDPPRTSKLTWGVIMAALAAILLVAGGLDGLQQAEIIVATPFGIIILAICWSLLKTLAADYREQTREAVTGRPATGGAAPGDQPATEGGGSDEP